MQKRLTIYSPGSKPAQNAQFYSAEIPREHFPRSIIARMTLTSHEKIGRVGDDATRILARKLLHYRVFQKL